MVKKKQSVISGQLSAVEEARELPYLLGAWKGVDHYRCRECSVDSFDKKIILQHLVDKHNSEDALALLVELESPTPSALRASPPNSESTNLGEKEVKLLQQDIKNAGKFKQGQSGKEQQKQEKQE